VIDGNYLGTDHDFAAIVRAIEAARELGNQRAFDSVREGRELVDTHRASPSGLLRVACPITMARDAIAPLMGKFIETFPELRVELETYSSEFDQEPKKHRRFLSRFGHRKIRPADSFLPGVVRALFASHKYVQTRGTPAEPADLVSYRCIDRGGGPYQKGGRL